MKHMQRRQTGIIANDKVITKLRSNPPKERKLDIIKDL